MIRQACFLAVIAAGLACSSPALADDPGRALKQQWWLLQTAGGALQLVWFEETERGRVTMRCASPAVRSWECDRPQTVAGEVHVEPGSNATAFKTSTGHRLVPHWVVPTSGSRHGH